jgi:hypothetical protein
MPSDEEPIATGGRQGQWNMGIRMTLERFLPPPVTPSDEEPIATGGRRFP